MGVSCGCSRTTRDLMRCKCTANAWATLGGLARFAFPRLQGVMIPFPAVLASFDSLAHFAAARDLHENMSLARLADLGGSRTHLRIGVTRDVTSDRSQRSQQPPDTSHSSVLSSSISPDFPPLYAAAAAPQLSQLLVRLVLIRTSLSCIPPRWWPSSTNASSETPPTFVFIVPRFRKHAWISPPPIYIFSVCTRPLNTSILTK